MKCELKYVAHSYKTTLMNIKYVLVIIAGVIIGISLDIPKYIVYIFVVVPFIMSYIGGYICCKKNKKQILIKGE